MILDNIENLGKLIEIANYLGLQEIETEIDAIKKRTLQENASTDNHINIIKHERN